VNGAAAPRAADPAGQIVLSGAGVVAGNSHGDPGFPVDLNDEIEAQIR